MLEINCYIPLDKGKKVSKLAWGLWENAKKLAGSDATINGWLVHAGLDIKELQLPFDYLYSIEIDESEWYVSEQHFKACKEILQEISLENNQAFLFSSGALYKEISVHLLHSLGGAFVSNVKEANRIQKILKVKREIYGGKATEYVNVTEPNVLLIFDDAFLYGTHEGKAPKKVVELQKSLTGSNIKLIKHSKLSREELALTEAKCVIGIGRGVYETDSFPVILELANLLNAPIGGSKVADELNLIPREHRIGASGIALEEADVYIPIGISGSSQHLEGIKDVKHVIAINSDPSAPIFKRCDIGIVGRYEEVLPRLIHEIKRGEEAGHVENRTLI